jgi:hypothetical protein
MVVAIVERTRATRQEVDWGFRRMSTKPTRESGRDIVHVSGIFAARVDLTNSPTGI